MILTCEATEGRINAGRLPGLPYSFICTLAASRLSYDVFPASEGFEFIVTLIQPFKET